MARQNRDDPGSLEEQLAWLDAIKENEDVPTSLDTVGEEAGSPYPKDPWLAVPAEPAPNPPPMFRAAVDAVYNPAPVAVADEPGSADTTRIDDPLATRPVKPQGSGSGGASSTGAASSSNPGAGSSAGGSTASGASVPGSSGDSGWGASGGSGRFGDAYGLSGGSSGREASPDATAGRSGTSADPGRSDSYGASGGRAADTSAGGSAGSAGRGTPSSGFGRSDDAYGSIGGLGAFATGGSADTDTSGRASTDAGRSDDASGGSSTGSSRAGTTGTASSGRAPSGLGRTDDSYLEPLPKPAKSDPLGLGAFGDRGRDTGEHPTGSRGAFDTESRVSFPSSASAPDSDTSNEPVRGWLEPAVPPPSAAAEPAVTDDEDELEQKRFAAFMSGGDVRDRDVAPRVDRKTHKRETPPESSHGTRQADPLAGPTRRARSLASPRRTL